MVGTDRQSGGVSAEKGEKRVILSFTCNGLTRRIQRVENAVVAVRQDYAVDTVRMIFRPEEFNNIPLASVSVKFLYVDTDGEIKAYQTGTTPDGGVYTADWELTDDVVDDAGYINFAVKLAAVNGDTVEKQWFSIPDTFRVYDSVDDTNNPPGETAAEQATNAEKIAQLQSGLGQTNSTLSQVQADLDAAEAALDALNSRFLYFQDANSAEDGQSVSERLKASVQRVLTTFSERSPSVSMTYTIMIVTTGAAAATLVGTINVTATAMRFILTYNMSTYTGTFNRGSATVEPWIDSPTRTEVNNIQTTLTNIGANYKNLGASTAIPSNSDLNNYTTPGSYSAQSNNIAATIAHAPTTRAFTLDVENALGLASSAWRRQVLRASASPSDVYQRFTGGNAWSDWEKVPTVIDITAKLNKPTDNGTDGQFLRSNGDGTTRWDSGMDEAEVSAAVTEWLEENVAGGQTIAVDKSLTVSDAAADAKVVGDEVTNLNSTIKDITGNTVIPLQYQGKTANLSGSSVTMSGGVPQYSSADANYDCGYISCSEGDVFTINGAGGALARLYGFIASDGTILAKSGESWIRTNLVVTAPANSAFLMINNKKSDGRSSYVGELLSVKVNNLDNKSANYYSINNLEFAYGGIYNSSINTDTNRIHSVELLKVSKGTRIEFLGGFAGLVVAAYDQFGNYLTNNPWSESWTITQDGYIRIILRKSTTNAQIATSDFANLVSAVSVVYNFPSDYSKAMEYYWQASNVLNNLKKNATAEFVFFSDIHGGNINFNRIIEYAENGSIDAILNGGDTAQIYLNDNSHPITWYTDGIDSSGVDILSAVGNHDVWTGAYWTKAQATDVYNAFIKPIVTKFTGMVQPENAEALGLCYYYKDYGSVRVIVLNAMSGSASVEFWDTTEANWLTSVLADAKSNSKHVLIVNHPPFQKTVAVRDIQNPWNSFLNYTTLSTYDGIYVTPDAVQIVQDFITAGGVFIGWLSGHLHFDNVITATGFDGQIMINIASAKYGNHPDGASYNDLDIKDYDCFNHIAVDTTMGLFKVMRVGWNTDYSLKTRNVFSYDYINKTILATS